MKKYIEHILVIVLATLALLFVLTNPATAEANHTGAGCTSGTFLHVQCAEGLAMHLWNTTNGYSWRYRKNYIRHNANRVDIYGAGFRWSTFGCRWIIVRGHDFSKYAYWHPSYGFNAGCGGV